MTQITKSLLTIDDVLNYRSSSVEEKERIKSVLSTFLNSVLRFKEREAGSQLTYEMHYVISMVFPDRIATSFKLTSDVPSELVSEDYKIAITVRPFDFCHRHKVIHTDRSAAKTAAEALTAITVDLLSAISKRLALGGIYMDVAKRYASLSTCMRRHVGAILVKNGRIISTGTNGSPEGTPHCIDEGCLLDDKNHCQRTVHAEQNAILFCASEGISMKGASIYCTDFPCTKCLQSILQTGIKAIYFERDYTDIYNKILAGSVQHTMEFYSYDKGYFSKLVSFAPNPGK